MTAALGKTVNYDSIVGPVTFDDHGQNTVPLISKYVAQDGKWVVWEDSEYGSGKRKLAAQSDSRRGVRPAPARARSRASACARGSDRMDITLLGQYVINGLMLGVMYGLVAVGFTLFFGVLDVIKFSHGDVLTVGVFTGFATYLALKAAQIGSPLLQLIALSRRRHGGDGGCSAR